MAEKSKSVFICPMKVRDTKRPDCGCQVALKARNRTGIDIEYVDVTDSRSLERNEKAKLSDLLVSELLNKIRHHLSLANTTAPMEYLWKPG